MEEIKTQDTAHTVLQCTTIQESVYSELMYFPFWYIPKFSASLILYILINTHDGSYLR